MRISKYTILKYVCVISLELTIAACVSTQYFKKYDDKYKLPLFSLDKQIKKAEKDDIVEENESLKKAFENRIKKGEYAKKVPGKYKFNNVSEITFKPDKKIVFTKYNVYNKKTNRKVGEGYIALVDEKMDIDLLNYSNYISYITYIKVFNKDNPSENYEVKEPGFLTSFDFEKIEVNK